MLFTDEGRKCRVGKCIAFCEAFCETQTGNGNGVLTCIFICPGVKISHWLNLSLSATWKEEKETLKSVKCSVFEKWALLSCSGSSQPASSAHVLENMYNISLKGPKCYLVDVQLL